MTRRNYRWIKFARRVKASEPRGAAALGAARHARRRETRLLLELAFPVVCTQLGIMLMGTVDVMMLGRLSEEGLAAGALGNAVGFGLLVFPMGLLLGLDPLIAQAHGAGEGGRIAGHLWRGALLAIVMSIPVSIAMLDAGWLLRVLGQEEPLRSQAAAYLRALIPGNAAFLLFGVVRQVLQGMNIVRPAFFAIVLANVGNAVANWAFIFGHLGIPALGVEGAGYATSTARWMMLVFLVLVSARVLRPYRRSPGREALRPAAFRRLFTLGIPVGFQISLEMWVFGTVAVIMGSIGATQLAGHQIALNLAALSFMVPLGLAAAAAVRVGNAIGRGDQEGALRAANVSLAIGASVMACFGLLFATFPHQLARLFTPERGAIEVAAMLLPIAAAFQIADGTQVVGAGILRGTADTRFPAIIAFLGYWVIGLPAGLVLAFPMGMGPRGLWWGLTLGLASVAVMFVTRIRVRFRAHIGRAEEHPAEADGP
ncbi:MAG TPA: MATE family efflux transporter [Thermoanaerobaculia bacterium]|nr:MATE family efflux transporter [Thermoanaerobaculia bacterium]